MAGAGIAKNVGGRPVQRGEPKRSAIAVRTTSAIKDALQTAADEAGRSLTQEIEQRLERSVENDQLRGSARTILLLEALASEIAAIEQATGKHWFEDRTTFHAMVEGVYFTALSRGPDMVDSAAIEETRLALVAATDRKNQAIHYLQSIGVWDAAPPPGLSTKLTGMFGNTASRPSGGESGGLLLGMIGTSDASSDPYERRAAAVRRRSFQHADGTPFSHDEKEVVVQAIYDVRDLEVAETKARAAFLAAYEPEREAQEKGVEIVKALRNRSITSAMLRAKLNGA